MFLEIILDSELDLHSKVFSQSPETSGRPSKTAFKILLQICILTTTVHPGIFLVPNKQRHNIPPLPTKFRLAYNSYYPSSCKK